jgi:nucleotide-binding universal stress UspA family protein
MYDDILLPYDGSDGAGAILGHAASIAHWADATVNVLFVADTNQTSVSVVGTHAVDGLVNRGEEVVAEAAEALDSYGVAHETDVVQGNPAPTVVEYAETYDQDLIVVPTHGRTGLSRYLVGSVAEKIVRLATTPVLTARMHPDEELTFPYEQILLPTDGSEAARAAATHGLALAAALDATVHLLSVIDDTSLGPDVRSVVVEEAVQEAAHAAVDDLAEMAAERGVADVVRHVDRGAPVASIRDRVEAVDAHAVVMGTTGRRGTDRILLGSVAEQTVRSASVPVITVGREATEPE